MVKAAVFGGKVFREGTGVRNMVVSGEKTGFRFLATAFSACFCLVMSMLPERAAAEPVSGQLRAGTDSRELVSLSGFPLAGYGGGDRRKTIPWTDGYTFFFNAEEGEHDLLRVKTLVLEVEGPPAKLLAVVSTDTVAIAGNIITAVVQALEGTGLERENIFFIATHTHSGPGALTDKVFWQIVAADILNLTMFDHVTGKIADSIHAALGNLQPAELGTGVGFEDEISRNRRHDSGPVDNRVGVIKVVSGDGDPIGVLFNFAVHPTSLGSSNMLRSADNVGYAERMLEIELPGAVALFVNAAQGDVAPEGGGFDGAQYVGETLGARVLEIWDSTDTSGSAILEIRTSMENLPPLELNLPECDDLTAQLLGTWMVQLPGPLAEEEALFAAARINDHAFITVPGEAITEIGFQIQAELDGRGFEEIFIMGLANGYIGYIMTPEEYDIGGYEACGTLHGRDTGVFVKEKAVSVGMELTSLVQPEEPDAGVDSGLTHDAGEHEADSGSIAEDAFATADGKVIDGSADPGSSSAGCGCSLGKGSEQSRSICLFILLVLLSVAFFVRRVV